MNQTVSLCEFDIVERVFSPACQTNCFTGEASSIYDPCGNLISLVAQSTGAEVWARAVDKNSTQAIGLYNPHAIEMPFVGDGTVMPPYEEPIVSPIAFTIGGSGFNVKDHLASNTDLTIAIGQNGAHASIYGDDNCGEEPCGGKWKVYCDWQLCDFKLLDDNGEFKKYTEVSLYNCLFISCCEDAWKKKADSHNQKAGELMVLRHLEILVNTCDTDYE